MTKKLFFKLVVLIPLIAIMVGLVLPWLMSAKSTVAVALAICAMFLIAVFVIYKLIFNKKENLK